ncbi:DUF4296 domain-containing protein [Flavobacterium psychrotrophum]|uniref:DUF4296 domain-containing protein n=1 Tax=Flavobacterium psychrotrophum TaxID=2294119 RepID=UPI000E31B97F|nr:DUF4296 domain-containing protein [Flavobacterium psychrotrophum]
MKKLVFILLSALAVSCGNENAPKPERLLSEDEMVDILYDISLLQAVKSYKSQILDTNSVDPRTYIYKKYKLDSITLSQNHNWYASDLENYEKIQGRVSNRIRSEHDKLKPKKKGNPDKLIAKPGLGTGQQREHKIE